jgi:hypothetical protein
MVVKDKYVRNIPSEVLLHDVRYVLYLKVDLHYSSFIWIHSFQFVVIVVCLIFHLIYSLYLFEVGNFDFGSVVCDLGT